MRFNDHDTWIENSLQNVTSYFKSGKNINAKMILEEGLYPVYGGNGIRGFTNTYNQDGKYILVGRQGALCGNVRLVEGKSYVTEHGIIIINNNQSTIEYLKPLLEHMHLEKESDQSAQPGLAVNKLLLLKQYFPSIENQERIGKLFTLLEMKIQLQNKIIEEKRLLKNLIIDKIFFKSNTDFVPLSSLINLKNGYAFKSDCYSNSDGYKVITIGNVSGDRYLDLKKFNCISILPIDIQEHQILKRGDLLISLTGNVGRVSICNESNCVLNQRVGLIEFFDEDDKEYIYQIMSSKRFQNDMISRAQGAAQLNIGKDDILNYRIPYLNDSIKRKKISSVLSILDNVILTDENLLYAYDKQKQFLLNNLFI